MENISYIGLSHQVALRQQMNIAANNIANISTPGFKGQSMLFLEYLNKDEHAPRSTTIKQVLDFASYRDVTQGTLRQTFNDLDVALQGDGYLAVQTPGGIRYTRDGALSLNAQRELVNASGYPVLDDGDNPITLPENAAKINISADGTVSSEAGVAGRLKLVDFENPQALRELGENLYSAPDGEQPLATDETKVIQGALEQSNVNPILEMNKMIEVLRNYQAAQRMIMNDHERIRTAIQKLSKV